jgi:hypothetical protein
MGMQQFLRKCSWDHHCNKLDGSVIGHWCDALGCGKAAISCSLLCLVCYAYVVMPRELCEPGYHHAVQLCMLQRTQQGRCSCGCRLVAVSLSVSNKCYVKELCVAQQQIIALPAIH